MTTEQKPLGPQRQTSDEIRSKILETFEQFRPQLLAHGKYAQSIAALSKEYHDARLHDTCPAVPVEELVLAASLDARETPKSLDTKLDQLISANIQIKKIIYDTTRATYHLFV